MKYSLLLSLLVITQLASGAQSPPPSASPSDTLSIVEYRWRKDYPPMDVDSLFPTASSNAPGLGWPREPARVPRMGFRKPFFSYELKVANIGTRVVTAVGWDYVFIDPTNNREEGRRSFSSTIKIAPGKKKTLRGATPTFPTSTVSAAALEKDAKKPFKEEVFITCIAFADGTSWFARPGHSERCGGSPAHRRAR
jgi:hypothetical protein